MNASLFEPFSAAEVKCVIFNMFPLKSPGPDEAFSSLVQCAEREGRLSRIAVARQAPEVSHLLFVDDMLVFYKANEEELREVKRILEVYAKALGKIINF
ncbi:UNVERIFIED_CONTAM: hypothetical protein Scaly_2962300 [Sesamum calycinum]|uniref:Reverse transcriptase n=1 Tax=Sesamum calycinum TaxID=2727403 RepID=A0AAW2KQJ3_9LAMI